MPSMNKVILIGNLTHDPEGKKTSAGSQLAEFSIACNERYKTEEGVGAEKVTFVPVTVWGKTASFVLEHFEKGKPILIEGKLKMDSWDDKATGKKRTKLSVTGQRVQFIEPAKITTTGNGTVGDIHTAKKEAAEPELIPF
jgi:single-strand DNA-binding protein